MHSQKYKKPTFKRYTLNKILEGVFIVGLGIFIVQTLANFYTDKNPYNGYCCCNLELIDEPFDASDNYGIKSYYDNSFCIRYNSTTKTTYVHWPTQGHPHRYVIDKVKKITNKFRKQLGINYDEFNRYLYFRKFPYWTPNVPCYHTLNRFKLKERKMVKLQL